MASGRWIFCNRASRSCAGDAVPEAIRAPAARLATDPVRNDLRSIQAFYHRPPYHAKLSHHRSVTYIAVPVVKAKYGGKQANSADGHTPRRATTSQFPVYRQTVWDGGFNVISHLLGMAITGRHNARHAPVGACDCRCSRQYGSPAARLRPDRCGNGFLRKRAHPRCHR